MRKILVLLLLLAIAIVPAAQAQSVPARTSAAAPPASTMPAPVPDVSGSLSKLNQVVENSRVDLARLRIEKWKADSSTKRQSQANADSLQRNMTAALPGMVQQVRSNPGSVAAAFKLYRNLNALYEVMLSLAESAGAFGSKDDYQALANDTANLDDVRRSLADQVEAMAASRDNEVGYLQARLRQSTAATTAAPPRKTVIDDNAPEKKPAKKPAAKKKPAATQTQGQQATPPKSQ